MNIIISNNSSVPIYEQLENAIKEAIFSNELKEEDMLPSVRSLANDLKISFLTVKRAYDELEQAGFIKTVQGKGSFVAPKNLELIKEEKLKEIQDYIEKIYDIWGGFLVWKIILNYKMYQKNIMILNLKMLLLMCHKVAS